MVQTNVRLSETQLQGRRALAVSTGATQSSIRSSCVSVNARCVPSGENPILLIRPPAGMLVIGFSSSPPIRFRRKPLRNDSRLRHLLNRRQAGPLHLQQPLGVRCDGNQRR